MAIKFCKLFLQASDIDAGRNNIRRFFVAPEDTPWGKNQFLQYSEITKK